jgi:hypothetical protein
MITKAARAVCPWEPTALWPPADEALNLFDVTVLI